MTKRTDADRFASTPTPLEISLGGRKFKLAIQRKGQTAKFKRKLIACLGEVERLKTAVEMAVAMADAEEVKLAELPYADFVLLVVNFIADGSENLLNLVYEYDPKAFTKADRAWCEDNAFGDDYIPVIVEIFKVVYGPFVRQLLPILSTATGLGMKPTTTPDSDGTS